MGHPLFGGLITGRGHDRERVGNVHFEGARADAARVVGNHDGDHVDVVVGVGVVKPERLVGVDHQRLLAAAVAVIDRRRPARPARVNERTGTSKLEPSVLFPSAPALTIGLPEPIERTSCLVSAVATHPGSIVANVLVGGVA